MFPSSSRDRKPLIRSHSGSGGPTMRNWPLFGFLIGLVLFFYAFYIFQAQSGELSLLKETNDRLSIQLDKLRTDDLAHKTDLEKLQTEITNLRKDKDQSDADNRQCSTNLEELKSKVSQLTAERTELTDSQKASEDHVRELTAKLEELQRNATSQEQQLSSQVILVQQLNETVHILRNELDKKQAAAAAPVAVQPPQGSNVENQVAPVAAGFSRAPLVVAANEGQGGAEIARPLNNLGDLINPQQKKSEGVGNEEAGPKDVEAPMNPLTEQQPAPAAGDSDAAAAAIPAPNQLKDDTAAKEAPVVKDDVLAPGARVRLEEKTENEDKQDGLVAAANEEKKEVAAVPKPAVKDGEYEDADDVDRAGEKEDKEAVKEEEDSPKR